ncbi:uncharacterized protein [Cicer arietinum]|uniref:uncharacterized protein isoform X2 n=1 Tax=Cicer arietinum TaxID=3827 RepID=UPI003CC53F13
MEAMPQGHSPCLLASFSSYFILFSFGIINCQNPCQCWPNILLLHSVDLHSGYNLFWDAEQGPYMPLLHQDVTNESRTEHLADPQINIPKNQIAPVWSYIFQILFQISAGAVMLTDCVYWIIIFPFLTLRDYDLNFMTVNLHTLNLVLLFGDAALNCLRIHWSGMSFFVLWTGVYVIVQWIIHACVSIWWPYPFLDLSSPYAPLWYLLLAFMHIPCYGFFMLILEIKHHVLSKWFPSSCQC